MSELLAAITLSCPEADIVRHELGNPELPFYKKRPEIEKALRENSVIVAIGPTGSGKSTQLPQIACEMEHNGAPLFDEIIVTQPRIVAARTLSERVASEIAPTGQNYSVGYYTSKEGTFAPQRTRDIAFLTDGKAAAQLLHGMGNEKSDKKMLLIVDEVHEWNQYIDSLVAITAEMTNPRSKHYDENLTVVFMSATMDDKLLTKHYAKSKPAHIVAEVPMYPVKRLVSSRSVAEAALQHSSDTKGKILAFLAGKKEIGSVISAIAESQNEVDEDHKLTVVPLHGKLTANQQRRAFVDYPNGALIAATNVAETSVTVPGVVAVVDTGEVRVNRVRYDLVEAGSESLNIEDAPQSSLNQRAGRAGRQGPGVYELCSQKGDTPPLPFDKRPEYGTPEIQRSALDSLMLHFKASGHEISDFPFFHEPPEQALDAARKRLYVLGALDEDGIVTERGLKMERLPLEPEFSCMVVFAMENGYKQEVVNNVVDIAAIMQRGGIFKRTPNDQGWRKLLPEGKTGENLETDSDYIAQLEAYFALMNTVEKKDWGQFSIVKNSVDLVEQGRESLARVLGVALPPVSAVEPEDRQAVLTCINAGQLNQLWRRNGEEWNLLSGSDVGYEASESSVVTYVGKLVTGKLFSLGTRNKTYTTVQDINRVPNNDSLAKSAAHLVEEVCSRDAFFDTKRNELVVEVQRKLGTYVLSTYMKSVEAEEGSSAAEDARKRAREDVWNSWEGLKEPRKDYSISDVDQAIKEPESRQYGVDPITNEPMFAWRGGKGWCKTKEIAIGSLEAHKAQQDKRPMKDMQRAIKNDVRSIRGQLLASKKIRGTNQDSIKRLLNNQANTEEWLAEARRFLGIER